MLNKLERALGKYAIPNLMRYLIGGYVLGYFFDVGKPHYQCKLSDLYDPRALLYYP